MVCSLGLGIPGTRNIYILFPASLENMCIDFIESMRPGG